MRSPVILAAALACATGVAAQTPDAASERTKQHAGQSGAAISHTITPGPGEPSEITSTATGSVALSADQHSRLKAYFAQADRREKDQSRASFTVSVGAAVPKQVALQPLSPALQSILPTYKGDEYVLVQHQLVIATRDRRIVAIIPDVSG